MIYADSRLPALRMSHRDPPLPPPGRKVEDQPHQKKVYRDADIARNLLSLLEKFKIEPPFIAYCKYTVVRTF